MTAYPSIIDPGALAHTGATNIIMILDRSGSMAGQESDVIGGFNSFVANCRSAGVAECRVSYVRFDGEIEHVFTHRLADVPELNATLYAPRGSTALLDAVGQSVSAVTDDPNDRYIVITFTDGHENQSKEWTRAKVATLIKEREALGNWTFAFFGAEIDAWGEAGDMGYRAGNTRAHAKDKTADMMAATGRVASVQMKNARMRSSEFYADAVEAATDDPGLSDEALERRLAGEADEAPR